MDTLKKIDLFLGEALTTPEKHQLKIAKDTLKMAPAMVGVMGGMTRKEAKEIIKKLGKKK